MRFLYIVILFASVNLLSESIYNFQNTEDEIRFNNLVKEIRCPKCTSGSLASSNAPISQDLKLKIVEMINNNKSDEEIKEYIIDQAKDLIQDQIGGFMPDVPSVTGDVVPTGPLNPLSTLPKF